MGLYLRPYFTDSLRRSFKLVVAVLFSVAALGSCEKTEKQEAAVSPPSSDTLLGRAIYRTSCIQCHNADPSKDGPLGPAVSGSSIELLKLRVLEGKYPKDYSPKRDSHLMVPLPHLKNQIPALHQFLNSKP